MDLDGDSQRIGKNLGDDLAEGKPTLPLLYAMRNGNALQRDMIRRAIEQGGLEELQSVIQAVHETGALNHVVQLAKAEADAACAAIASLPETRFKQTMLDLAAFAVARKY